MTRARYLVAYAAHARDVPVDEREHCAGVLAERPTEEAVVVTTCHRVEAYLEPGPLAEELQTTLPRRGTWLRDEAAVRQAFALALGTDAAVLGEDQLLHQLRRAVAAAGERGLPDVLRMLFQVALREGRRTRSWRPRPFRSLADVALDRVAGILASDGGPDSLDGRKVLVVGAGEMGILLVRAARRRAAVVSVASRDGDRAASIASRVGAATLPFDPGPRVADFDAVAVALGGPWTIGAESVATLRRHAPSIVDLSAPPAVPLDVRRHLGARFVSIDSLAVGPPSNEEARHRRRLEAAAEAAVAEFHAWRESRGSTAAIRAIADRAEEERAAELEHLWRQLPRIGLEERLAIEAMTRHLAARLLREPFSRLRQDADGRRAAAARELFGL